MCFIIPSRQLKAKVATEPIFCFKTVHKEYPYGENYGRYRSHHRRFPYQDGHRYKKPNFKADRAMYQRGNATSEGFHSHIEPTNPGDFFGKVEIACLIPEGARYFINRKENEFFSNQLVVLGEY